MTTPAEQEAWLNRLESVVEKGERISGVRATGNQSTVTINAGGIGVWIAVTCCLIMLFSGLIAAFWVSSEFSRTNAQMTTLRNDNDVMRQYLSSIYQQAPWIKPPPEEKKDGD